MGRAESPNRHGRVGTANARLWHDPPPWAVGRELGSNVDRTLAAGKPQGAGGTVQHPAVPFERIVASCRMSTSSASAATALRALEAAEITHVMGIPDNASAALFDLLADHPSIRLVTVTREGEAFAIASGVWLGGGSPLVVVQNTGLLESGDALRGTAARMAVPLPIVVTGRGYTKMDRAGLVPGGPLDPATVTRADVDSVALHTEPTLDAWGVPFTRTDSDTAAEALDRTIQRARQEERPVAMILVGALA